MQQPLPSAPCEDVEVTQHESAYKNDLYTEQKPASVQPSKVQITHVETPQQQAHKPVMDSSAPVTTTTYVQQPKTNMSSANTNSSYNNNNNNDISNNNNGKAAGKEHCNTLMDENTQGVRLPKGNWFKAEGTQYYYSAIENLYYHPPSKQFYDPTNEMWYDPSTREWYRDDATEDDSTTVRA